jgi:putative transcriptional regulator
MAIKIKVSDLLGKYKMTQKQLSYETGIRPATISSYYHETISRIEVSHLNKFCTTFKCQPGDIFEFIPDK